ncbi:hypothetical protein [Rosenbergiella nectarea]|uniref:hypothetical protein n=1 Tax=Rosenbergiella nectarea TaxID=988801 RepID=UPI001F4D3937|nr:hypothetical protein [Rosenbergiella nectarea]
MNKNCVAIDLKDLLAFSQKGFPIEHIRKFTDWAENKIISGCSNDNLLILASLGLDNIIEQYEVKLWFNRVISELNVPIKPAITNIFYYHRYLFKCMMNADDDGVLYDLLLESSSYNWDVNNYSWFKMIDFFSEIRTNLFDDCYSDDEFTYFTRDIFFEIKKEGRKEYLHDVSKRFFKFLDNDDNYYLIT